LIDGRRDVAEILDRAFLSDFDVYKGLADLLDRNLIVEGRVSRPVSAAAGPAARPARFASAPVWFWAAILGVVLLAVWLVPRNPWNLLLRPANQTRESTSLFKSVSLARLLVLERAVRIFYDSSGQYPRSLEDLVVAGVVGEEALEDPYGRAYRYILRPEDGKFGLYGRNAEGNIDLDLSLDRTLAPVAEIKPASARTRPTERRPGVQVIE
jgi:hypothetical protein